MPRTVGRRRTLIGNRCYTGAPPPQRGDGVEKDHHRGGIPDGMEGRTPSESAVHAAAMGITGAWTAGVRPVGFQKAIVVGQYAILVAIWHLFGRGVHPGGPRTEPLPTGNAGPSTVAIVRTLEGLLPVSLLARRTIGSESVALSPPEC